MTGAPIRAARALMSQRVERPDSRDDFPTPPWATRALMEVVLPHLGLTQEHRGLWRSCWEPACGRGIMAAVLREYFDEVHKSDAHQYGDVPEIIDFLGATMPRLLAGPQIDWVITNPPFSGVPDNYGRRLDRALEFTIRALKIARLGVAMFTRTQWAVEGRARHERLFKPCPPTLFAPFTERVPLCRGHWNPSGTTATAYCWLVWLKPPLQYQPWAPLWIPAGQRKALTKPDDAERFSYGIELSKTNSIQVSELSRSLIE